MHPKRSRRSLPPDGKPGGLVRHVRLEFRLGNLPRSSAFWKWCRPRPLAYFDFFLSATTTVFAGRASCHPRPLPISILGKGCVPSPVRRSCFLYVGLTPVEDKCKELKRTSQPLHGGPLTSPPSTSHPSIDLSRRMPHFSQWTTAEDAALLQSINKHFGRAPTADKGDEHLWALVMAEVPRVHSRGSGLLRWKRLSSASDS